MIEEFNMDSKAEYSASSTLSQKKKKLKQTNASAPLIQYRFRSMKAVRKKLSSKVVSWITTQTILDVLDKCQHW